MSDFVDLSLLSPVTKKAWEDISDSRGWPDLDGTFHQPESIAWLWFRLRALPDYPETFPKGKWASLQHLESILDGMATREEESREPFA